MLLPKVVSSPHRHVSTQLQKTSKSSNSCRIARLLYTISILYKKAHKSLCVLQDKKKIKEFCYYSAMAIAERLFQIGAEIQGLENELRQRRRVLESFLGHLLPRNPAGIGARMEAINKKIADLEGRLKILRQRQQDLIVEAVEKYHRRD